MELNEQKDKTKIKITDLLKAHPQGLTITEIMQRTGLARHTVLARLHNLVGQDKVSVRQINMAKLHYWKDQPPSKEELEEVLGKAKEKAELVPLEEKHIKIPEKKKIEVKKEEKKKGEEEAKEEAGFDMSKIKEEIEKKIKGGQIKKQHAQILKQRAPASHVVERSKEKKGKLSNGNILTCIPGFDELFENGIPKSSPVLVAGGAGSGKTIFCSQLLINQSSQGKKCFYMSFEESEKRLKQHMEEFGWNPNELIKKDYLRIQRFNPFDITRNVDAMLAKQKGELLIEIEPVILPKDFKPDFVVVDSLTAIASAFTGKEESYRIYIEQLFRFFEKLGSTSFLITETKQIPEIFSTSGVEEFLADGVIVFYNIRRGDIRESAIEVLKMRGEKHQKKIVAMTIGDNGITVYPEQEVFGGIEEEE